MTFSANSNYADNIFIGHGLGLPFVPKPCYCYESSNTWLPQIGKIFHSWWDLWRSSLKLNTFFIMEYPLSLLFLFRFLSEKNAQSHICSNIDFFRFMVFSVKKMIFCSCIGKSMKVKSWVKCLKPKLSLKFLAHVNKLTRILLLLFFKYWQEAYIIWSENSIQITLSQMTQPRTE